MNYRCFIVTLLVVLGLANISKPCTTFVLQDGEALLFCRNFDWFCDDGLVIVNQRGIAKTAFPVPTGNPVRWVSKHGSITFNQFGREMPCGGINEAGLVVETMVLRDTGYAKPDDRAVISGAQWVQYQLDNCRSVKEVIGTDTTLRVFAIPNVSINPHYLICDSSGDVATIEFLNGKMVCHHGPNLPLKALANTVYEKSIQFVKRGDGVGAPEHRNSLTRFSKAGKSAKEFRSSSPDEDRNVAFSILKSVSQDSTRWSVIYDIPKRRLYYRTQKNPRIRWISVADFDFSPRTEPVCIDANGPGEGHVAEQHEKLTAKRHRRYLRAFFGREDVKKRMGDLSSAMEKLMATVGTYKPE